MLKHKHFTVHVYSLDFESLQREQLVHSNLFRNLERESKQMRKVVGDIFCNKVGH